MCLGNILKHFAIVNMTKTRLKEHVIQSKNGIIMNVGVSIKNQMIVVLAKMIKCRFLACVIVNVRKHVKLINIQVLKIALGKKRAVG